MKHSLKQRRTGFRVFILALALMLGFGIVHPAASASAESFLATHKDEIADAIVNARSNLASLRDDLAAIEEAVQAREAARQAAQPASEQASPSQPAAPAEGSGAADPAPVEAPAAEESGSSLRDDLLSRLGAGESGDGSGGLVSVDIGDVNADLHDNPIEHDITVESDVMHDNTFEHDWSVNVDNSRFNNNTIIRYRETTPSRTTPGYTPASTNPKTGDLNNVTLWIVIVAVSALALAAVAFFLLRRRKKR